MSKTNSPKLNIKRGIFLCLNKDYIKKKKEKRDEYLENYHFNRVDFCHCGNFCHINKRKIKKPAQRRLFAPPERRTEMGEKRNKPLYIFYLGRETDI